MALSRPVTNQQIGVFLALKEAGVGLNVDDFDSRLILQKSVYLLQSAKVHLGYQYRWYVRGPYCSALADDLFYLDGFNTDEKAELATYHLDAKSQSNIERIRGLFAQPQGDLARHLELLASAMFLFVTRQSVPDDGEETAQVLRNAGKDFDAKDVDRAVAELRANGLIQ